MAPPQDGCADGGAPDAHAVPAASEVATSVAVGCGVYCAARGAVSLTSAAGADLHTPAAKAVCLAHAILSPLCGAVAAHRIHATPPEAYRPLTLLTRHVWWETGYYIVDCALEIYGAAKRNDVGARLGGTLLHHLVPLAAAYAYSKYRAVKAADRAKAHTVDWLTACLFAANTSTIFHHILWFLERLALPGVWRVLARRAALVGFFATFIGARFVGLLALIRMLSRRMVPRGTEPSLAHGWSLMPLRCRVSVAVFSALNACWLYVRVRRTLRGA